MPDVSEAKETAMTNEEFKVQWEEYERQMAVGKALFKAHTARFRRRQVQIEEQLAESRRRTEELIRLAEAEVEAYERRPFLSRLLGLPR